MKRQSGIELRIDELTLASMPHGGERRLRESVERELTRLLRREQAAETGPREPGAEIAAKIHKGLRQS